MLSRRGSRMLALQILFVAEFQQEDIREIADRTCQSLDVKLSDFAWQLVQKTYEHKTELDEIIRRHLYNWDLKRISTLDRVLVRMAVAEMLYFQDIPVEVTINEALEIGKDFCSLKSCRFINGILDAIYRDLREQKLINKVTRRMATPQADDKGKHW